jgi:carboxylate-amine ligase
MSVEQIRASKGATLGVELELQLVDGKSMALTDAASRVLARVPVWTRGAIKPEFHECCVEIITGVCRDVSEVERELIRNLLAIGRAAATQQLSLAWGGTHPFSHWQEQKVASLPRYKELAEHYGDTLCRQVTFGMHVHVGVGDLETAIRVCDGLTQYLPVLLALSANSPFWCGRATGMHSHRVEVMGSIPTGGLPPRLHDYDGYARLVERLVTMGLIQTEKELWWDARPSPGNGTVEVRICDMPPDLPSVSGLTALIQCLVFSLAHASDRLSGLDGCGEQVVRLNRWRASRFGLEAVLVDPWSGGKSTAREIAKRLVVRLRSTAEALHCSTQLDWVSRMADGPGGAERQLATFNQTGDLAAVVMRMTGNPGQSPESVSRSRVDRGPEVRGSGPLGYPAPAYGS